MKKLFFVVVILFGLQSIVSAQLSKADIDQIMKEMEPAKTKLKLYT